MAVLGFTCETAWAQEVDSTLAKAVHAIESPSITGEMDAPPALQVGRAEIQPAAGSKLYVLSAQGKAVGYLLTGSSKFVYRVEDRFSIPSAHHNLKEADGVKLSQEGDVLTATANLEGAALWGELPAGEVRPLEGMALPGWLRELLLKQYTGDPARDVLSVEHNGGEGHFWALLKGTGEDFILDVDPRPLARSERLSRLLKPRGNGLGPFSGRRFSQRLVEQPTAGTAWWDPEAIEVASIGTEIHVRNAKGNHVEVTTRTKLQAQRPGLRLLTFRLQDGVLDRSSQWHPYRVTHLTVNGQPAPYVHRKGDLLVTLPAASQKGQVFLLEVKAEGNIIVRPSGDNYWRFGGESWYPKPGSGGQEWSEFHVTVEVAEPQVPFAGGEVIERGSADGLNRVVTHLKGPMEYMMVIAGKYHTVTEEMGDGRVHISSYAAVKDEEANRIAQVVLSVQECLESWLGVPYPFPDLQVVEMNQWGWAQAPPGIIFITQEAFLTRASAKLDLESTLGSAFASRGINPRVAHEVAHAWFPHVAKVVRPEENWLSESFADYASAVCLEQKMSNKKKGRQYFDRQLQEWKSWSKGAGETTSVYLAHLLSGADSYDFRIRYNLLYGRGPLVLHAIRQHLQEKHGEEQGDRMFFVWIRSYIKNFTYKAAATPHLIAMLNQISGEDWQPFFERHIYGPETPEIK